MFLKYILFFISFLFYFCLSTSQTNNEISPIIGSDSYHYHNNNNNNNNKDKIIVKTIDEKIKQNENILNKKLNIKLDVGFLHAFVASLSVIIVSELGDKTFFIAAILSMKNSRVLVFFGAISALILMTILSAVLGFATTFIPRWFTYYLSSILFAIFGIKMLKEAYSLSDNEAEEEYEEVQKEINKKDILEIDVEAGTIIKTPQRRILYSLFSRVFIESLTLTFLAEWGDRSQIATIILAARDEVIGVVLGGILGHSLCTFLAVLAGRFISKHLSLKTVHFIGGVIFIIFALSAFFIQPEDHQ